MLIEVYKTEESKDHPPIRVFTSLSYIFQQYKEQLGIKKDV